MHLRRVITEQLSQVLFVIAGLVDRIVLTGVLLRYWGTETFETWSLALSMSGLVALFELGFNLYYNNRQMAETEQGRLEDARRTLQVSNSVFALTSTLGLILIGWAALSYEPPAGAERMQFQLAMLILVIGAALRIAVSGVLSLYRANREYARLIKILAVGELARVGASILMVIAGGGMAAVAAAGTLASVIVHVVLPLIDTGRRYSSGTFGFALPRRNELRETFAMSAGFFVQNVPIILLGTVPVIALGAWSAAGGAIAIFVLMRTLSGLPRTLLQQFGIAFGQEVGRRVAVAEITGAHIVLREGGRLFSVLSGIATGFLIACGAQFVILWTGSAALYRADYLTAATLPMLVAAMSVMAHNVLVASNAPYFAAAGRLLQLAVTLVLALTLPIEDLALRMLVALSLGEILGFAPLAYFGLARLVPETTALFHLREIAMTVATAVVSGGIGYGVIYAIQPTTSGQRIAALMIVAVASAAIIPLVGFRRDYRRVVLGHLLAYTPQRLRWWFGGARGL